MPDVSKRVRSSYKFISQILTLFSFSLSSANSSDSESKYCNDCEELANKARRKSLVAGGVALPPSSAKIREITRIMNEITNRSDSEEKTIIFSQFTSMLDLIQPFLRRDHIRYVRCKSS